MNDSIDGVVKTVLADLGIPLPGGDPDAIRTIAGQWDTMGTNLTQLSTTLGYHVNQLESDDWSGDARDGFDQHWDNHSQNIDDMAAKFHDVCKGLHDYADEIEEINNEIIDTCVEIAEMVAAGAVLTVFTAGISDLVGDAAAVAKGVRVASLVEKFAKAAEKIGKWIKKIWTEVKEFLKLFKTNFVKSFWTNFAANTGGNLYADAQQKREKGENLTLGDVGRDVTDGAISAFGTAAVGGLVGGLGGNAGGTVTGAVGNAVGGETKDWADDWMSTNVPSLGFSSHNGGQQLEDAGLNLVTGAVGSKGGVGLNTGLNAAGGVAENYFGDPEKWFSDGTDDSKKKS